MIIEESGMRFGDYPDAHVFHIEQSVPYRKKLMPNGVKTCEFILLKDSVLYLVEAKKSCPRQISEDTPQEKIAKYNAYIADVTCKVRDSLALYAGILLKIHDTDGISDEMLKADLSDRPINIVLVIKKADGEGPALLRDKLEYVLAKERRIWKARVYVLNEESARKGLFNKLHNT